MRPGQLAPDGRAAGRSNRTPRRRFNEAGAVGPGWPDRKREPYPQFHLGVLQ